MQEWLDCGLPETLIQTNTWLLQNKDGLNNVNRVAVDQRHSIHNVKLFPPCFIGNGVEIKNCTIGPNVTIGNNCKLSNVVMSNSIMWKNESVYDANIENQIIASC